MIIFPAIDIKNGKVVRLRRGRMEDATVFAEDPLEVARYWRSQGAQWLHIVDLDGAVEGRRVNAAIIGDICRILPVQVGGGIRDMEAARQYVEAGARRLIVSTIALENPDVFREMCEAFCVGVSLDAEAGRLKTRGWLGVTDLEATQVLPGLADSGAAFIIYTDILRDGMSCGANIPALAEILEATELPVLAAGGVTTLQDVKDIHALSGHGNLAGVISGRALYEKSLDFQQATAWLAQPHTGMIP